jgi:pre-mRNA-splicing factor SPF27
MIEEEMRRYKPAKNYLESLPLRMKAFETSILKAEMERIALRQPMEMLSMHRYELPAPSAAQKNDVVAWQEAVENSMAQLEHQALRIINLELLSQYGSAAWRAHNEVLKRMLQEEQNSLEVIRSQIQEVNRQRKLEQSKAGDELSRLETHWQDLVRKNYKIEEACMQLQSEIKQLQKMASERDISLNSN